MFRVVRILPRRLLSQRRWQPSLVAQSITGISSLQMETSVDPLQNDQNTSVSITPLSKNAQKRLLKQQKYEVKKTEKKAQMKEHKKMEGERKRREWDEKLASLGDEERDKLIDERKNQRKERMEKKSEERAKRIERLQEARINGQNLVIDLEFSDLMSCTELHSLVQQIMHCYAVNGRCSLPANIWLTGCEGGMQKHLLHIPGYDRWIIGKEDRSYIDAFQDQKENLVYLTADSESVLDELDPKSIYIVGGMVDRNRWKGITLKKANEQGIRTAKLPIGTYMKMSGSQVLTVNQVVEVLLKFIETKDWKDAFFQVIPQRKRCETSPDDDNSGNVELKGDEEGDEKSLLK